MANIATLSREVIQTNANQANIQPLYEVYANADGRDLGSIATEINKIVADEQKQLTPGNRIEVVGQIDSMNAAFRDLAIGILFAAVFVYLLMVVNYQTWGDPFVVILALPATFCGIVTMLYLTGTTLSVPSLMGAIMAVGVASANSILLVTFAREQQLAGMSAFDAAIAAGRTRIRPVLMTAAAMIVGMIPMAIGGAGEEQNAALARAVIGGLLFATPTTLLIVPYLFALLRKGNDGKPRGAFLRGFTMKRSFWIGSALLLAGLLAYGTWLHFSLHAQVMETAKARAEFVPSVRVAAVQASASTWPITLPATTSAFAAANIYARATGYISRRDVDIGDHVKAGQLLAEITAPELDHQIAQSEATLVQLKAALQQAQANRDLANVTWGRDKPLVDKGWVTPQQGDTDRLTLAAQDAAVGVAQANIKQQQAQLQVLHQQKDYQSVVAPFDGVITQRNIDIGSLVQADATSGTFMFTIMHTDVIRVQLYVPQEAAFGLKPGVQANIRVPELPGRAFPGLGHAACQCAAADLAHLVDRDRRAQSGRRAYAGDLLSGRSENSAQHAFVDRAVSGADLQPGRTERSGGREWPRPSAPHRRGARLRHHRRGERGRARGRSGDPQSVGRSRRGEQGCAAAGAVGSEGFVGWVELCETTAVAHR